MGSLEVQVSAYAVRANVPVQKLAEELALPVVGTDRKHVILRAGDGYVVGHSFGALVLFGSAASLEKKAIDAWRAISGVSEPRPTTTESFRITIDESQKPAARFDRIVVPVLTQSMVELVALVVGQSVALEHLETEVDETLEKLSKHARELRDSGTFRAGRRELLKLIGNGMALGNRAVFALSLLDAPLASWDDETQDRLFGELQRAFGIEERYRALDHKLVKVQGGLELLVNLIQHQRALFIEVVVVALIALEIVLAFVRH